MASPASLAAAKASVPAKKKAGKLRGKTANALANLKRKAGLDKLKAKAGFESVLQTGEFAGAAFLSALAGGYLDANLAVGEASRLQVFGIDARLAAGLGLSGYGAYNAFKGSDSAGHLIAIGGGLMAAPLVQMGQEVGASMATSGTGFAGLLGGNKAAPAQFQGMPHAQPQPQFRPVG